MATAEECRTALESLIGRIADMDAKDRAAHLVDRTLSCRVPDLGLTFVTRLGPHGAEPIRRRARRRRKRRSGSSPTATSWSPSPAIPAASCGPGCPASSRSRAACSTCCTCASSCSPGGGPAFDIMSIPVRQTGHSGRRRAPELLIVSSDYSLGRFQRVGWRSSMAFWAHARRRRGLADGTQLDDALTGRVLTRSDFRVPRYATTDLTGRTVTETRLARQAPADPGSTATSPCTPT